MDQLFDAGEALFEVNPSKLQTWLDCPRQYAYMYVERRTERRPSPYASLGRSVHNALREFFGLPAEDRTLDTLIACLQRSWDGFGFATKQDAESARAIAENMLRRYVTKQDPSGVRTVALESKFHCTRPDANILVTGRVDRIDRDADGYVIIDYKTGRFRQDPKSVEESLPLSLYAMAVSGRFGRQVTRIELHHLALGERTCTTRDADRLSRDWELLEANVEAMRTQTEFAPRPGPMCKGCHFLSVCPEGAAHVRQD